MGQCDRPPGNEDMSWQPCSQKRFTCTDYRITIGQERDSQRSLQMQPCYRHRRGELSKSCSYPCFTLNASIFNYGMLHTHCDVSYTACTARHEAVHSCETLRSFHWIWLKAELKQVLVNVKFPCFKWLSAVVARLLLRLVLCVCSHPRLLGCIRAPPCMGLASSCSRRRRTNIIDGEPDWIIIPAVVVPVHVQSQARIRWKLSIVRVLHLVFLRRLFVKLGLFLKHRANHQLAYRPIIAQTWSIVGKHLQTKKSLTFHLRRHGSH